MLENLVVVSFQVHGHSVQLCQNLIIILARHTHILICLPAVQQLRVVLSLCLISISKWRLGNLLSDILGGLLVVRGRIDVQGRLRSKEFVSLWLLDTRRPNMI